jgi:photosystem II stability/assembly factor-like uncharacterized protein
MRKLFLCFLAMAGYVQVFAQIQVDSYTLGAMDARLLGPGTMSGRITAIEGVNTENGKLLYIGTAGGGIWKTTNAGASFKPIFDKYCQSIGSIAIDQQNPKVIYAGTGESNMRNSVSIGDGLYKSTDGGDNWTKIGLDSTEHIAKVIIDPSNSNVIYVAAPGPLWNESPHRGLYKSTDAGKTWEKILYISPKAGCAEVVIDPKQPNTIYATTWEFRRTPYSFESGGSGSGIFKSTDGGKTWKELKNGLPAKPFGRVAFALAPSSPQNLFAIVEAEKTGLYISGDGGENWKAQSASQNVVSRPFYFSTLVVDPQDPKRVYRPAYSFAYSSDGGFSYAEAGNEGAWVHSDHHALWINPLNTNHMYLGTDGGVYMSLDRGGNWTFFQNLPVGQFYHVDVDKKDPYRVYGGLQDNGSWMGPSSAPGGVTSADWKAVYGGDGFWVVPDRIDENIVYAESQGGDISRINLNTFKRISIRPQQTDKEEKLRWNWNTPIVIGQANPKNLYTGAQYLYRSCNQGRTWDRISPDLTTNDKRKQQQENNGGLSADITSAENHTTIFAIAESPLDENIIWVGTDDGNLQVTVDGGKTWTNLVKNVAACGVPMGSWVSSIELSSSDKNVVYASFDNHMYGDHNTYAAVSADGGKTWKKFESKEFTGFAHKIVADKVNKNLLFLGTEMGLFSSIDNGENWFRMKNNNIPWYTLVRDIKIHPVTNDLIIGTHGRGIFIFDDITGMRNLSREVVEKDVVFFAPPPLVLTMGKLGSNGFPPSGGWTAPNAPEIPAFQYYLKEKLSSAAAKIEIYDKSGKLVQSVNGTTRKGINKLYWNQRIKPPKTAAGGTKRDVGAFIAPQVLPGDYTLKLIIGKNEYVQPLKVVHRDVDGFTSADRELQFKTAMELFTMHEDLAKIAGEISDRQKELKSLGTKIKNAKLIKQIDAYHTSLETLRATLLPTKQTSMFADESRLREDITEVYSAVCFTEQAPGNLQLERVKFLRSEVNKAAATKKQLDEAFEKKSGAAYKKEVEQLKAIPAK